MNPPPTLPTPILTPRAGDGEIAITKTVGTATTITITTTTSATGITRIAGEGVKEARGDQIASRAQMRMRRCPSMMCLGKMGATGVLRERGRGKGRRARRYHRV